MTDHDSRPPKRTTTEPTPEPSTPPDLPFEEPTPEIPTPEGATSSESDRAGPTPLASRDLFETVLTPVANPADGRETARAVRAYLPPDSVIYVAHVVQKGDGVPDKASVEQRQEFAERTYEAFGEELNRSNSPVTSIPSVTPVTLYGRNVPRTILAGAHDVGATAIVFTPRGAGRLMRLLTGSVAGSLTRQSDVPVVALPRLRERLVLD